jgi:hypothetical protein
MVWEYSYNEILGSNPVRGVDVRPCFSVSSCPVQVEALWWADPPSKDTYRNRSEGLIRETYKRLLVFRLLAMP